MALGRVEYITGGGRCLSSLGPSLGHADKIEALPTACHSSFLLHYVRRTWFDALLPTAVIYAPKAAFQATSLSLSSCTQPTNKSLEFPRDFLAARGPAHRNCNLRRIRHTSS